MANECGDYDQNMDDLNVFIGNLVKQRVTSK